MTIAVLVVGGGLVAGEELVGQLRADGFRADLASSHTHARALAGQHQPQVVILGGDEDGRIPLALLAEIRTAPPAGPWDPAAGVIVLGAGGDEVEVLRAFEHGADDFLAAPPRYLELRARLRALARRATRPARRPLRAGPLEVDVAARRALMAGRPLALSRLEFELLAHLAHEPHRVFTKGELLRDVWGFRSPGATRTLDSHACRLRRKLSDACDARWVANVWGVGYRLRG